MSEKKKTSKQIHKLATRIADALFTDGATRIALKRGLYPSDSTASDFNEHWESYTDAAALIAKHSKKGAK